MQRRRVQARKEPRGPSEPLASAHPSDFDGEIRSLTPLARKIGLESVSRALSVRIRCECALHACCAALLSKNPVDETLRQALSHLRQGVAASRAHIFVNVMDRSEGLCISQVCETCAEGIPSQTENPRRQRWAYSNGFGRWVETMRRGDVVTGIVSSFPDQERRILEPEGILSLAAIPISVHGQWHAFLEFDDCIREREWAPDDVRLLEVGAHIIGAYMQSQHDAASLKHLRADTQKALKDLRRQWQSLKFVIDNMPVGVIVVDADLRLVSWNNVYATQLGLAGWRRGKALSEVLPGADEAGITALLRQALETGQSLSERNFRYEGLAHDATYWRAAAIPVRLKLGEGPFDGVALIAVDVTQENLAGQRLAEMAAVAERQAQRAEAERRGLEAIVSAAPIPLAICDASTGAIKSNQAATELAPKLQLEEHLKRTLENQTSTARITHCADILDQRRSFSLTTGLVRNAAGEVTGAVAAALEITDQVRAGEEARLDYQREHRLVEKFQRCFLPEELPCIEGFEIAQLYQPAPDPAKVGGDFYDVFELGRGESRYGVVMADVAGKGMQAAGYTAMTKHMLRAYALEDSSPEAVLNRLNDALHEYTPSEIFVTLIYGVLDARRREFVYANAGHEEPVFCCSRSVTAGTLEVTGQALALEKGAVYAARTVRMRPGDMIVLYTDGITDAGSGRDRLGQSALIDVLRTSLSAPISELPNRIMEAVRAFAGGLLGDDAALLIFRAVQEGKTK